MAAGCDPPAVALLLVQLQLVLVDVEFSDQGIAVGAAQALVGVVQKELVVQFFLPPPQLAAGRIQLLFALLENRGDDSHGGQARQTRWGNMPAGGETARSTGQTRSSAGIFPEEPGSVLTKDELSIIYSMGSSSRESYGCQLRGALL